MTRKKVLSAPPPLDLSPIGATKGSTKRPAKKKAPARKAESTRASKRPKKDPNSAPATAIPSPIETSLEQLRKGLPADMQPAPAPEGWQKVPLPARAEPKANDPLDELLRVRCSECGCPDCPVIEGASRSLKGHRVRHSHSCRNCGHEFMHVHRLPEEPAASEHHDETTDSDSQDP